MEERIGIVSDTFCKIVSDTNFEECIGIVSDTFKKYLETHCAQGITSKSMLEKRPASAVQREEGLTRYAKSFSEEIKGGKALNCS